VGGPAAAPGKRLRATGPLAPWPLRNSTAGCPGGGATASLDGGVVNEDVAGD